MKGEHGFSVIDHVMIFYMETKSNFWGFKISYMKSLDL